MKKLFTLACALLGMIGAVKAASVDDIAVCKHSYVLVADDYTNNGTGARTKGGLFGDGFFLDVTGGSVATNKGKSNPAEMITPEDGEPYYRYGEAFAKKYEDVGEHYNSLRIKNAQDVIAMKVTAKSKIIILMHGNNTTGTKARIPKIAKDEKLNEALNAAPGEDHPKVDTGFMYEWTAPDDMTIYIGSYNGDAFIGMIIVEANEAPGTPTVKVGPQTYENGLWFREVTCKANDATEEGSDEAIPTVVTYTTDGTTPTAASPVYTAPIKCYKDQSVKFQAFLDLGDNKADDALICDGADNEGIVSFSFNAPTITVDGANVTIESEYEGAENYYKLGEGNYVKDNSVTLTESYTVTAYSEIVNGSYAIFTTKTTSKDVYVLSPIKEKKTITATGTVVVDDEATATSTTGTIYKVEDGVINVDKADFFVKNPEFAVVKDAKYQVPDGNEVYIKMNNTNITFMVAEGDSVDVVVTCSKNSCKTFNETNDENVTTDRKCYVNVSGKTYGTEDITMQNEDGTDGNIIKFGLNAGTYTFQKYSGTGNIMVASIEIIPAETSTGISSAVVENDVNAPAYNLAGQKVDASYKGIVIKNGKKFVNK